LSENVTANDKREKLTRVTQSVNYDLIEPHWRLDDLDLVAAFGDLFRDQQHVREQETVDVRLQRKYFFASRDLTPRWSTGKITLALYQMWLSLSVGSNPEQNFMHGDNGKFIRRNKYLFLYLYIIFIFINTDNVSDE
jgi:hypothetical protein